VKSPRLSFEFGEALAGDKVVRVVSAVCSIRKPFANRPVIARVAGKRYEHSQHRGLFDHLKYLRVSRHR
jgi:hypothetical protein